MKLVDDDDFDGTVVKNKVEGIKGKVGWKDLDGRFPSGFRCHYKGFHKWLQLIFSFLHSMHHRTIPSRTSRLDLFTDPSTQSLFI